MSSQEKKTNLILVSVIIPAYNAEKFIERTLQSVLCQTYKNIEVLVIDDGSQDRTAEIVKLIAEQDERIILLQQPNSGVAAARNLGIQKSSGEFIAPIDADDIWYPQNLEKQVQYMMESDASVGLVYAWSVDINEDDCLTGGFHVSEHEGEIYLPLLCSNFIGNGSSVLIRRTCLEEVGGYNYEQLKDEHSHGSEDWELYLRIAERYQFGVVREFLIGYRKTALSTSYNYTSMAKFYELLMQLIQQKHPEIPKYIYGWSGSNFYLYLAYQSHHSDHYWHSFVWLYKTIQLDLTMSILRHDIYLLTLNNLLKITLNFIKSLIFSKTYSDSQNPSKKSQKSTDKNLKISDIHLLVKIRGLLPYRLYEKYRLKKLNYPN